MTKLLCSCLIAIIASVLASCATRVDLQHHVVISVKDQRLALLDHRTLVATYPVSTSKYGLGDWLGSCRTPLGELEVAQKIGDGVPPGTVFKDRRRTGEIVQPDAPGRDPIVTRILWLRGRELRVYRNGRTIAPAGDTFRDALAPLAWRVYLVPP